jgi:ribosomal protein S18 acetylase RimI-like enzyme
MNYTIRKAKPFEAPVIMDYLQRHFIFAGIQDRSTITMKDIHHAFFEKEVAHALLAFEKESPVGLAIYYYNFSTLTGIFIDEAVRGNGYGKRLVNRVFEIAKEEGIQKVDWHVLKDNDRAIQMYREMGADLEEDLVVFTKELE